MTTKPDILILTPVKDASADLETYFASLDSLSYPRQYLSLGILESDSRDNTFECFQKNLPHLREQFCNVGLWQKHFGYRLPIGVPKRQHNVQLMRRSILARSRNHLLFKALQNQSWVLWLDVDVIEYPCDLIEQMLATKKNIVHPNCVLQYGGPSFDKNAWRGQNKQLLSDLRDGGPLVQLDSVGGTALLIAADLHRDGLIFPPFPYQARNSIPLPENVWCIETEGLGLMARDMGHRLWGLPHLEIRHKAE